MADLSEHDAKILGPKSRAKKSTHGRTEWGRARPYCFACGAGEYGLHVLTTHEIVGGSGGRSQEPANWLRLGMHPCHNLATGLDVADESTRRMERYGDRGAGRVATVRLLPKLPLGVILSMKRRAGELDEAGLKRLAELHGRPLPDLAEIPEMFVRLFKLNREGHPTKPRPTFNWRIPCGRCSKSPGRSSPRKCW